MSRPRSAAAILGLVLAIASGCSRPDAQADRRPLTPATPSVSSEDVRDRLFALGQAWLRTQADVTYRTVAPVPGQAASAHLCLRQMFNGETDRSTVLRMCSRQGRLRLNWDPPDRWRMDVTSPLDAYTVVSTDKGAFLCRDLHDARRCRSISKRAARTSTPFGFLFVSPERVLRAIGASEVSANSSSIEAEGVGDLAECFDAHGKDTRVVWCYSTAGILVSLLMGSSESGWTAIEADSISQDVTDDRFEAPG